MLQNVDKEVIQQVNQWLLADRACWLATVVQTWGSSPRPVGSLLACNADGEMVGSLSGGCVEDDLMERLTEGRLAAHAPQYFQYGVTAEETEKFGLPCGGHLDILVEPHAPSEAVRSQFLAIETALEERRCIRRIVTLKPGGFETIPDVDYAPLSWNPADETLTHTLGPRNQLFIIGAGMVSQYLAQMAKCLDYHITVCDPRTELLDQFPVPDVSKTDLMPDDAVRAYADDPATAIVALTHDPRIDDMGLMEALETQAFYIGAMGSTKSSASRRERLMALEVSEQNIDRLHAPIGLPIGSKTPPEIAVAIIAEITAVRKNILAQARSEGA